MKRVRMLLRVSSDKQLEADGDLSVQRQILQEFIAGQREWILDEKEYFEGSKSAYKNTAEERDVLQEILEDAKKGEFDILVPYKDDRVGRLMLNTSLYVVTLKKYNVDVYSVKDGCISPKSEDDIEGMMLLLFRYANAQKSSKDTGMRVKDTARKMVQNGKFMGGLAPYGYKLEYSGEISKHGRALKHLVIVPEKAGVVKYIYNLSLTKEYGSAKIAKTLNRDEKCRALAPNGLWKSGTITDILKNPIYAGYTAYKRRERINGKYHRLDSRDWIISFEANDEIAIIDFDTWNRVQEIRKKRGNKYTPKPGESPANVIKRNDGMLPLIDVLHCGYCGGKMMNGSKYNYWTIKGTGEKRASKIPIYQCRAAKQGIPHEKEKQYGANRLEAIIFEILSDCMENLIEKENVFEYMKQCRNAERKQLEKLVEKERQELFKLQEKVDVMESHIPDAMLGDYPLSLEELAAMIDRQKGQLIRQQERVKQKEQDLKNRSVKTRVQPMSIEPILTWKDVFLKADTAVKRVLVNKLIERIDVKQDEMIIRFKINLNDSKDKYRIGDGFGVPEQRL